ncbi:ribosome maturation factor RimM [Alkalibacterium sp. MB6]|uniref:ribosome maturation factor RimM n=1 Tax=Alkalibacterium sp. MB6 TaxID=2081965 RepID=UPI001379A672|nr:ribosome maturation factor RimM [Alkalibacterium sp. MB6]
MEYFDVGKVVNTHGLKGEVRVISITNLPEVRYQTGEPLTWFGEDGTSVELTVKSHRVHKSFDLLTFEGYSSINDVEHFVGGMLRVNEEQMIELPENEFFISDIIGSLVVEDTGEEVGKVKEVLETGANDVWVIQRQGKKDLLIPYIESVVLDVDVDDKRVTIHMMEGLDE